MARKSPEYKVTYVYKPLSPEEEERRTREIIRILGDIILRHVKSQALQVEKEDSHHGNSDY